MEESKVSTNLVVIGAGPGGYAAAFYAADLGMQVTLVDRRENPGGVCLYEGCIPSKAFLHAAHLKEQMQSAEHFGWSFGKAKLDLDRLRKHKSEVVAKLTGGLGGLAKQRKVKYIQGEASFLDAYSLRIQLPDGNAQTLTFEHAIVATGSVPVKIATWPDSKRVMDSTVALQIPDVPDSLLVVGGGYIGLEMGSVYAGLGSRVTVVEMADALLPGTDPDLVRPLQKHLESGFAEILLSTEVVDMQEVGKQIQVQLKGNHIHAGASKRRFDRVLVAIGRRPLTTGLGLDHTAMRLTGNGFIYIDEQCRTTERHIFAIGDIVGGAMLAHKASHEAKVAVDAILGKKRIFEPRAIPAVVFTDPEIAYCGLTEAAAAEQNIPVKITRFGWAASGRAMSLNRTEGLTKLIFHPDTGMLLGAGLVGVGVGEMIAGLALAVEMGATAQDLALTIHPHPTLSESIMEAAEVFLGHSTHLYRPRK